MVPILFENQIVLQCLAKRKNTGRTNQAEHKVFNTLSRGETLVDWSNSVGFTTLYEYI